MYECKSEFGNAEEICKVKKTFPWRALLLSVSRLLVCLFSFVYGSSTLVLKADGSLGTKQLVKNKYKYLKYSHNSITVPVLSLSLLNDPTHCSVAALSSFSLLVAVVLSYKRTSKPQNASGEGKIKNETPKIMDFLIFILTSLELIFSATDMINNTSEALNHAHLLINYVSIYEGLAFLMTTSIITGFQIYFWFGGLDFVNNFLLKEEKQSED